MLSGFLHVHDEWNSVMVIRHILVPRSRHQMRWCCTKRCSHDVDISLPCTDFSWLSSTVQFVLYAFIYVHVLVLYIHISYPCIPVISQLVLVIVQTCLLNSKDDVYEHAADIACMFLQTSLAQYGWGSTISRESIEVLNRHLCWVDLNSVIAGEKIVKTVLCALRPMRNYCTRESSTRHIGC